MIVYDVIWESNQAGPSPDNNIRTEVFLKGCQRAIEGNPCDDCFNKELWSNKSKIDYTPEEVAKNIIKYSSNKYVTFVGGEPLDQIKDLIGVTKILKSKGYHIIVFTWRELKNILNNKDSFITREMILELLKYVDIIIDGEYDKTNRIFNNKMNNGLHNAIGSGNQTIWNIKYNIGFRAEDLAALKIKNGELLYYKKKETKNIKERMRRLHVK